MQQLPTIEEFVFYHPLYVDRTGFGLMGNLEDTKHSKNISFYTIRAYPYSFTTAFILRFHA